MRDVNRAMIARGTDPDLIEVARWRARFEVGRGLSRGQDPSEVRREVLGRFLRDLNEESFGPYADEALMAALQREVELALASGVQ